EFIILHNNDMHARFEQTNMKSGTCSKDDAKKNKCCGGFARVANIVRKYRKAADSGGLPVIFLNAGDVYTGTAWFTIFKHEIVTDFMNKLAPDAISLGNHEFDKNIAGLVPFLNGASYPILACNLNTKGEPDIASSKLAKSTILTVKDVKVGVIGFLTPDTAFLAAKNKLVFYDEIPSINAEAKKLKSQGINILIAVGHSGYKTDQEIAKNCPEVDVVVGAHSHTYLDANKPVADITDSSPEAVRGPYPTVVVQSSGKKVPVVQAYAFTKYMGKLKVKFDSKGNLKDFSGAPILLGPKMPQEQDMLDLLGKYRPKVEELERTIYGKTNVLLEGGGICRNRECNLGNLISDAMVFTRVMENEDNHWTDAPIGLIQGGGIRASIEKEADRNINGATLMTVLPFENDVMMTRIKGKKLLAALEHSATTRLRDSNGGFLQMSGLKVVYDYNNPEGKRVVSALARCSNCSVPVYEPIKEDATYQVIVLEYVLEGGDGYDLNDDDNPHNERLLLNDINCAINYIKLQQFVYSKMEERITIVESDRASMRGSPFAFLLILITFLQNRIF
ncbi:hypothetical protein KR067_005184, partial [Drosophila pandora]